MDLSYDRRRFLGCVGQALTAAACIMTSGRATAAQFEVQRSAHVWRRRLGAERYHILREGGTERPFSSPELREKRNGVFACAGCGLPLFSSAVKYESRTGWPSFWESLVGAVAYRRDLSLGMIRVEEHCRRCGGHLGHLFDDGPRPTGKRHCINGLSLVFRPAS